MKALMPHQQIRKLQAKAQSFLQFCFQDFAATLTRAPIEACQLASMDFIQPPSGYSGQMLIAPTPRSCKNK